MHPYESYIERTAATCYDNRYHESYCETLKPYRPPTDSTGFVYDVYFTPQCDCWLTENLDNLTLERKFQALRDLSYRHNLHSPACERYRTEKITYRNKPEILTFPCNCWLSVDITPSDPVDSTTMTTETTLDPLYTAQRIVRDLNTSRKELETHLAPFLKQYIALKDESDPRYFNEKDREVTTFKCVEDKLFIFEGEPYYEYGDYETPSIELPFAFVEDPEGYTEKERKRIAEQAAKFSEAQREAAQRRIDSLTRQIEAEKARLSTLPVDNSQKMD